MTRTSITTHPASKSTKAANDWQLVYSEPHPTRSDAMKRENFIKKQKSRRFIESLIEAKTD